MAQRINAKPLKTRGHADGISYFALKRRLFKLVLILFLGVVVNVAVAWCFTAKLEFESLLFAENEKIIDESEWPGGVP